MMLSALILSMLLPISCFFQVSTVTGHNLQSAPILRHRDCVRRHAALHPFGNVHVQLNRFSVLSSVQCGARLISIQYRGADKSLARPGRKQATATEDFEFHIAYL